MIRWIGLAPWELEFPFPGERGGGAAPPGALRKALRGLSHARSWSHLCGFCRRMSTPRTVTAQNNTGERGGGAAPPGAPLPLLLPLPLSLSLPPSLLSRGGPVPDHVPSAPDKDPLHSWRQASSEAARHHRGRYGLAGTMYLLVGLTIASVRLLLLYYSQA